MQLCDSTIEKYGINQDAQSSIRVLLLMQGELISITELPLAGLLVWLSLHHNGFVVFYLEHKGNYGLEKESS